jgi:hypothetical protein
VMCVRGNILGWEEEVNAAQIMSQEQIPAIPRIVPFNVQLRSQSKLQTDRC